MSTNLVNDNYLHTIQNELGSFLEKKEPDCILYAEGSKFKIHKECFSQTQFMRNILATTQGNCCSIVEIICPCPKNDLENLVNFLYGGEIRSIEEFDTWKIIENLIKIFGFSKDIRKNCLIKECDESDTLNIDASISDDINASTEESLETVSPPNTIPEKEPVVGHSKPDRKEEESARKSDKNQEENIKESDNLDTQSINIIFRSAGSLGIKAEPLPIAGHSKTAKNQEENVEELDSSYTWSINTCDLYTSDEELFENISSPKTDLKGNCD